MTNNFIERVRSAHRRICRDIEHEQQRKVPQSMRLVQLKKVRLLLKDRLVRLQKSGAAQN